MVFVFPSAIIGIQIENIVLSALLNDAIYVYTKERYCEVGVVSPPIEKGEELVYLETVID